MRHMSAFDPSQPATVHDALNDRSFAWIPSEHEASYREHAAMQPDGLVMWDGLMLDGWEPV